MKKLIIIAAILFTGFLTSVKAETKIINHSGFEFGFFYSNLAPYGSWIEIDAGLVVWRPTIIHTGWAPYREGRWIWTVHGWYWDSYEPFGHIVFHYGRWYYDDYYGWIWIPDYEWAPAWVEWRYDDAYIGWAPLPPYAVFSIHIGIHFTHDYHIPYHHWHYVTYNRFCDPHVYKYYVAPKYKYRIHSRTKVRHNYSYRDGYIVNNGVDIDLVRKRSGQNIKQRNIVAVNDYREFEKSRNKNDDVVRTFVASRDEISKSGRDIKDVKIEKKERKSSLDVSKVRLGGDDVRNMTKDNLSDKNKERSAIRNNETKERKTVDKSNDRIEVKRNEEIKNEKRENVVVPERKVERREVKNEVKKEDTRVIEQRNQEQKREINVKKNNNDKPKIEVRKDNNDNKKNDTQQKRNETKVQVNREQNNVKREKRKVERNTDSNKKERKR